MNGIGKEQELSKKELSPFSLQSWLVLGFGAPDSSVESVLESTTRNFWSNDHRTTMIPTLLLSGQETSSGTNNHLLLTFNTKELLCCKQLKTALWNTIQNHRRERAHSKPPSRTRTRPKSPSRTHHSDRQPVKNYIPRYLQPCVNGNLLLTLSFSPTTEQQ